MKTNKFNIPALFVNDYSEYIHNVIEHYPILFNNRMDITRWIGSNKFGIEIKRYEK